LGSQELSGQQTAGKEFGIGIAMSLLIGCTGGHARKQLNYHRIEKI
jgi:hypothetical protein